MCGSKIMLNKMLDLALGWYQMSQAVMESDLGSGKCLLVPLSY